MSILPRIIGPNPSSCLVYLKGKPGSGKGTIGPAIVNAFALDYLCSSNVLSRSLSYDDQMVMKRGGLVDSNLVTALMVNTLLRKASSKGAVLDGFPRTVIQAAAFEKVACRFNRVVLHLEVSDSLAMARMEGRLVCQTCLFSYHELFFPPKTKGVCDCCTTPLIKRADDNWVTIQNRLRLDASLRGDLLCYFKKKQITVVNIDGSQSVESVKEQALAALRARLDRC